MSAKFFKLAVVLTIVGSCMIVNSACDLANGTVRDCLFRTIAVSPYNGQSFWAVQNGTVQIICYGSFGCTPDESRGILKNEVTGQNYFTIHRYGTTNRPMFYLDPISLGWGEYGHDYWGKLKTLTSSDYASFTVGPVAKPVLESSTEH